MKIEFGRTWSYDDDLITVSQAEIVEAAGPWSWTLTTEDGKTETRTGRSVFDWRQAVGESQAKAFRYLYWIMAAQNGEDLPVDAVSFAFPKFVAAFVAGWRAEVEARQAEEEQDPTQAAGQTSQPPGQKPGGTPRASSRRRSPGS